MALPPPDIAAIFEGLPNAFMILDRELRYEAANAAYLNVAGARLGDLLGRYIFDVFPDDENAAALKASFARVLATGRVDELAALKYRVPTAPGQPPKERVWSARHTPFLDERGQVVRIVQETTDISHLSDVAPGTELEASLTARALRIQSQATLQEMQLLSLRQMFAQAPGFMCFLSGPEHVFTIVNDAYMQLVGHRHVIGMRVRDALPEVVEQGFIALLDRVYGTGTPFLGNDLSVELQRTPGAALERCHVDFIYQPIRNAEGVVIGIFVQGQDVTAQHHAEAERLLAEARREFLIEVVPNQVWTATPEGKLDFISGRVVDYFQRPAEQILGDGWLAVLHPDDVDTTVARWMRSLRTGDPYEAEFRLRDAAGEYRWHLGRANPERDSRGEIVKWIGTNTDTHEAKVALYELTQRAQYEQRLIGIVSHDLRNPFSAMTLGAAMLAELDLDPAARRILARISRAADRGSRLVNDLLDFAKARIGATIPINPRPTNLREIIEEVVDECQASAPGRVITIGHVGDEYGTWDSDRIAQVISNLVGNALQHGSPSAPIIVESRISGDDAVLTIENEGPGIGKEQLGKLFEPYQRGMDAAPRHGSMGLGLFIAREVIAAHGGTIEVDSQPHSRTRFTVRLPRVVSATAAVA